MGFSKMWYGDCNVESKKAKSFKPKKEEITKMKNMRNIVAAIVMVTVLSVSTFAGIVIGGKDGIVIGGRAEQKQCGSTTRNILAQFAGIVIGGFTGIVIGGRSGILISDRSTCDQSRDGIVIGG